MSSRGQHFRQAERLLDDVVVVRAQRADTNAVHLTSGTPDPAELLNEAQVHAMLALVGSAAYEEYLDLVHTERLREDVVNAPPPDTRDWLKDDEEL
jgi:hypothetical protein